MDSLQLGYVSLVCHTPTVWHLCLYLPALFSLQNLTLANVELISCYTMEVIWNTCSQLGKVISTWQGWSILIDGLRTSIAWRRVKVSKQRAAEAAACTNHVSKCLAKSQEGQTGWHSAKGWGAGVGSAVRTRRWLFEGCCGPRCAAGPWELGAVPSGSPRRSSSSGAFVLFPNAVLRFSCSGLAWTADRTVLLGR